MAEGRNYKGKYVHGLEGETRKILLNPPYDNLKNQSNYIEVFYIKDIDDEKEWVTDPTDSEDILKTGYVKVSKAEQERYEG